MRPRRRPAFAAPADPALMKDLNTTPLIDVMLVLLVMFIMVIPMQLNQIPLELPGNGPVTNESPIHRLDIAANGAILWDGGAVSEASLPARFAALAHDPAAPLLQIAADGSARYELFSRTLSAARKAGITRLGMVGHERFQPMLDGR